MTESDPALPQLAGWLSSFRWPLSKDELLALADQRGWTVTSDRPGRGARWSTGSRAPEASASVLDGVLATLTVPTSRHDDDDPAGRRQRRDAFAIQVSVVPDVLGPPAQQRAGRSPSAVWQLPNRSALKVGASSCCYWVLTSPKLVEIQRDLGPRA